MLRNRVIPVLLLKGDGLVKTIRFKKPTYVGDPLNAIKIFNEKEVDELVLLDIEATVKRQPPQYKLLEKIASECFMPLSYGGGLSTVDECRRIFELGIEKVIINSTAWKNPQLITDLSQTFGSQSVVVSIDAAKGWMKGYRVYVRSGSTKIKTDPAEYAKQMVEYGAGEIFINSIDQDGRMNGYDFDLIKLVSESVHVPVIACGGAASVSDFQKAIEKCGASAVGAGSMFVFQGPHRAVLINFPSPKELSFLYNSKGTK